MILWLAFTPAKAQGRGPGNALLRQSAAPQLKSKLRTTAAVFFWESAKPAGQREAFPLC